MFKTIGIWIRRFKKLLSLNSTPSPTAPNNLPSHSPIIKPNFATKTDSTQKTNTEIHALINFIEAYEKDNAERLKKEQEIEERLWHRDKK